MHHVLSVASECAPLVKTGGLADVVGALPKALAAHGVDMRVLLPGYPAVIAALGKSSTVHQIGDLFGGTARLVEVQHESLPLLVLDAPHLFERKGGIYLDEYGKDWPDNPARFAALCRIAAEIASGHMLDWIPHTLHCHDWQAGLAPYYLARQGSNVRSVMTIHNIAFQGLAPAERCGALGIAPEDFVPDRVEYYGQISMLKAGLLYASAITTVSPTYAEELLQPEFGMGFEGVLNARRDVLTGILNGIDEAVWSPEVDDHIEPYKRPRGKAANKKLLQKEFGLEPSHGPLCVVVSRLTEQKGLDLLLQALPSLLDRGGQLALLGSGDSALERAFENYDHPNVSVRIGYDEALSHRLIAGGDAILVPSRFEPCGLTQLYGLRYGTLPVVALTGGLADTVIDANPMALASKVATGLQFHPVTSDALAGALAKLCTIYANQKLWGKLQRNAMAQAVSWDTSAQSYAKLYQAL